MKENSQKQVLLSISNLKVHFFKSPKSIIKAVDGVSFVVEKGETFGIVGESGCGKSTTGRTIVGLIKPTDGKILLNNHEITGLKRKDRFDLSKKVQIIFQDSSVSLDPRFTIGNTIGEPLAVHKTKTKREIKSLVLELMNNVGLRSDLYNRHPHELSGGQRQRVSIARAIALNPELIVCDEPVSALDVSIQAQVLNLLKSLQKEYNLTYIFISHNLSVVRHICDTVAVMYLGHIMEIAPKKEIFTNPAHPYTKALINSIPMPNPEIKSLTETLEGDVPSPSNPPPGCVFHTRCKYARQECSSITPQLKYIGKNHSYACIANSVNNSKD